MKMAVLNAQILTSVHEWLWPSTMILYPLLQLLIMKHSHVRMVISALLVPHLVLVLSVQEIITVRLVQRFLAPMVTTLPTLVSDQLTSAFLAHPVRSVQPNLLVLLIALLDSTALARPLLMIKLPVAIVDMTARQYLVTQVTTAQLAPVSNFNVSLVHSKLLVRQLVVMLALLEAIARLLVC
jgi:hypothetical protein